MGYCFLEIFMGGGGQSGDREISPFSPPGKTLFRSLYTWPSLPFLLSLLIKGCQISV